MIYYLRGTDLVLVCQSPAAGTFTSSHGLLKLHGRICCIRKAKG